MSEPDDGGYEASAPSVNIEALRTLAREAAERAGKATRGPWRHGAAQKDRVFIPFIDALEGPNGERVLLRLNEHFPYEADALFIASARTDVPALASAVEQLADALEEAEHKLYEVSDELRTERKRHQQAAVDRDDHRHEIERMKSVVEAADALERRLTIDEYCKERVVMEFYDLREALEQLENV